MLDTIVSNAPKPNLRGDYSHADAHYVVEQRCGEYTADEHALWRRVKFDLERLLRTEYNIDRYQDTYFVIESFAQLIADTAPDFTPVYERVSTLPSYATDQAAPGDVLLSAATARPTAP